MPNSPLHRPDEGIAVAPAIHVSVLAIVALLLPGCSTIATQPDSRTLRAQVIATEQAFARTMATRDHAAFSGFIADDAVFLSGGPALRGREAVAAAWKSHFAAEKPPFSWEPDEVEVLDSGALALSTGPVWNADGKRIATFTSIWRQESPGVWRIIFDKGDDTCERPVR